MAKRPATSSVIIPADDLWVGWFNEVRSPEPELWEGPKPKATGILDADGNMIYHEAETIGFLPPLNHNPRS